MPDWGAGRYEVTAAELEPVARRVVAMAGPLRGERVLDIACGTGNAALLAAQFGASVTGVDQAPRLIEVAKQRAARENLDISFLVGDAQQLDFPDESFDVVLSVFGVIFAPDREQAFSELVRVMRPGGRAFVTTWLPEGAINRLVEVFTRAVTAATGSSQPAPRIDWHDMAAISELAAGHQATVGFQDGEIEFRSDSPEAYLASNQANHPMSLAMRPLLADAGTLDQVLEESLEILRTFNEDPEHFGVTSTYRILEIRR